MRSRPKLRFALAVPLEHRILGDAIAAYVVADGSLSEEGVSHHRTDRLGFADRPKVVIFGDEVPFTAARNASGSG